MGNNILDRPSEKIIDSLDYDPKKDDKKASRVKVSVVANTKRKILQREVKANVQVGSARWRS